MKYALGCDVSRYQGVIDWQKAKDAGISFAMIKMTEGSGLIDPNFKVNKAGVENIGIKYGFYHFWRPSAVPSEQFERIKNTLERNDAKITPLPFAIDVETNDGKTNITQGLVTLCKHLQEYFGYYPMIYTSAGFWNTQITFWSEWNKHSLWVANWNVQYPVLPRCWNSWYMWQHTANANGKEYGMESSKVDLNYLFADNEFQPPKPEETKPSSFTATVKVEIDGITYKGEAKLNKVNHE